MKKLLLLANFYSGKGIVLILLTITTAKALKLRFIPHNIQVILKT